MSAIAEPAPLDLNAWLRRIRGPAIFVVIGIALVAALAAIGRASNSTPFDPRNPAPDGTRALAALLTDRGDFVSEVDRVRQLSTGTGSTVVLSDPAAISDASLRAVATTRSTLVVLAPDDRALAALGVGAIVDDRVPGTETLAPQCGLPAATVAGTARISGTLYRVTSATSATSTCYLSGGDASLVATVRPSGGQTIVVGSPGTLTNGHLTSEGDAALALGIIDNATVEWAPASLQAGSAPRSQQGLRGLLPPRLMWATLQLFIAVVLLALWRARRLGALVPEPLPVVVRAAETVEGSGRLLNAARARAGSADALRAATIGRVARLIRISPDGGPSGVTPIVAEQSGRPAAAVNALLYGGEPSDDAALVRLARDLTALETDLRRDTHPGGQR